MIVHKSGSDTLRHDFSPGPGSLALVNLLYGYFVLPESLPADRRRAFTWKSANPVSTLRGLTQLKGAGLLMGRLLRLFRPKRLAVLGLLSLTLAYLLQAAALVLAVVHFRKQRLAILRPNP